MTVLSHAAPLPGLLLGCASFVRRSRSIASMLPALVLSGLATLLVTALMHAPGSGPRGPGAGFGSAWMESWLIAWPIAFPILYVLGSALLKLAASWPAPAARRAGLGFGDVADASARVTTNNGLRTVHEITSSIWRATDGRIAAPPVALCSRLHGAPGDTTLHPVSRVQIGKLFRTRS